MSIKEILAIEYKRGDDNKSLVTIHLHQEGNFLRAYEWSAWLCCRHMNEFKVTHRMFKNVQDDVVFVGFPGSSLTKWMPTDAAVVPIDDKNMDIVLSETILPEPFDLALLKDDFEQWKKSFPIVELPSSQNNNSDKQPEDSPAVGRMGLMGVAHKILEFPLERKSPLECYEFISDMKRQLAWML